MQNSTIHAAVRTVTLLLGFSVVGALLVKLGGLSLEAMVAWEVLLTLLGGVMLLASRSGGGGGPGRPIRAYVPVHVRSQRASR